MTPRQRLTFLAHLWKAVVRQHHREMEPLFARLLPADGVALDIGAHAGQFAKLLARLAPAGRIHAFEPGAYAGAILARALAWNGIRNAQIVPLGLSDAPGAAELAVPLKRSGSLGFGLSHLGTEGRPASRQTVELVRLDDWVAMVGLTRLDLVKIDVEGWELRALRGGAATLARYRPAILAEVVAGHLARAGDTPQALFDFLAGIGYRAARLDGSHVIEVDGFSGDGDYLFQTPAVA